MIWVASDRVLWGTWGEGHNTALGLGPPRLWVAMALVLGPAVLLPGAAKCREGCATPAVPWESEAQGAVAACTL